MLTNFEIARRRVGLTQAEFAKQLGIAPALVSQVERGYRTPWPKFRKGASEILGIAESELFGDINIPGRR
jgi:transcriptional regulator with XRE-family HTH domain